jgi:uncharacterized protein (TIGR01777 family)
MRIVITGGSGLIGSALARQMGALGNDVVVLTRTPERMGALPPGVRAAGWDGRGAAGWQALLEPAAAGAPGAGEVAGSGGGGGVAIVQLAGESVAAGRWTAERKRRIRDSRLLSGRAVVEAVRQAALAGAPPRVLLQASAVGYYGACGDEEAGEDHPPGDDFLAELAVAWERSTAEVETLGVRRVVLRTGIVLAREGGALPALLRPFRLGAGGALGNGRQWMPWIHLADEVAALSFLLESDAARGPYNLTAPQPVTNRELARAVGRALHRPSVLPAPAAVLHLVLGEMADMLLHGQRAVPRRLLDAGFSFRYSELAAALADLLR